MPVTTRSPSPPALPANLSFGERAIYVMAGLGLAAAAARPRPNPVLSVIALAAGSYSPGAAPPAATRSWA
jgi:hypothetical protein